MGLVASNTELMVCTPRCGTSREGAQTGLNDQAWEADGQRMRWPRTFGAKGVTKKRGREFEGVRV